MRISIMEKEMAKKHEESVTTDVETSVASVDDTVVEPISVEQIVGAPIIEQITEEPVVEIPEPEVKAEEIHVEEPKVVITPTAVITPQGTVVETRYSNMPAPARRYRLIMHPPIYPRGRQRAITYEMLKKYAPIGSDKDMSAEDVYKEVDREVAPMRFATAKTVDSIAWHLNQMLIRNEVECTSGRIAQTVERKVTPAEAMASKPLSLEEAISKGLIVLTPDQIAAMQLVK